MSQLCCDQMPEFRHLIPPANLHPLRLVRLPAIHLSILIKISVFQFRKVGASSLPLIHPSTRKRGCTNLCILSVHQVFRSSIHQHSATGGTFHGRTCGASSLPVIHLSTQKLAPERVFNMECASSLPVIHPSTQGRYANLRICG